MTADFAPAVFATLLEGRGLAEALMVDMVTFRRIDLDADGQPILISDGRGGRTPQRSVVYAGKAKIQVAEAQVSNPEAADHAFTTQRTTVHVPASAGPFRDGDEGTVDASTHMPQTVGTVCRVAGLHQKTFQTAQRLPVEWLTN